MAYIDKHGYAVLDDGPSGKSPKKIIAITVTVIIIIGIILLLSRCQDKGPPAKALSSSNTTATVENIEPTPTLANGEADPEQFYMQLDSRVIREEELYGFSKVQLQYIINSLYAMQGRSFKTPEYNSYYNSKRWYVSKNLTDEQAVALMNDIMLENLDILVKYRAKKGWNK